MPACCEQQMLTAVHLTATSVTNNNEWLKDYNTVQLQFISYFNLFALSKKSTMCVFGLILYLGELLGVGQIVDSDGQENIK